MRQPLTHVSIFGAYNTISIVKKKGNSTTKYSLIGIDKVVRIFTENNITLEVDGLANKVLLYGVTATKIDDQGIDTVIEYRSSH